MIRYDLECDNEHGFDGWFKDSAAFDEQAKAGVVVCPSCGSGNVRKSVMAPNIAPGKSRRLYTQGKNAPAKVLEAMRNLRRHVEETSDYVGDKFAEEARRIHYKETEERGIYGEASTGEIKDLSEEGIETCPLPVLPEDQN